MSSDPLPLPDVLGEPCVRAALALLEGAYRCALTLNRSPWDFALPDLQLQQTGVTESQLEALVASLILERRTDLTPPAADGVTSGGSLVSPQAPVCWFVLAPAGFGPASRQKAEGDGAVPRWDRCRRELWLGGRVVMRFRRAAGNQEYVLDRLLEGNWREPVVVLWVGLSEKQSAERLRQTVKSLNRGQSPRRLAFSVGADGRTVRWRALE